MYKIAVSGKVLNAEIQDMDSTDVEKFLRTKINDSILKSVDRQLDNFSFIDLKPNLDEGTFEWNADIVLCSESQVSSSIAMVVTNLANRGLSGEEITTILQPLQTNMEGW